MNNTTGPELAPQGDRFEDQYTSATADLSAGGVAAVLDSIQADRAADAPSPRVSPEWSPATPVENYHPGAPLESSAPVETGTGSLATPQTIGLGAAALLSIAGAAGGAWLYARWHRERNRPINRLRRGARGVTSRIGDRLPDVDDLPRAAPMSSAATALLLTGFLASRALQRASGDRADEVREQASDLLRDTAKRGRSAADRGRTLADRGDVADLARELVDRGRNESRRLASRLPMDRMPLDHVSLDLEQPKPRLTRGFGGLAILAGGGYLVWRLMHANRGPHGAERA